MSINISTSPAIFAWTPAAWLSVSGSDAASFLQGQFTNELRGLAPNGGAVYGLWLSVKGKVLADSFVLRGREEDQFWIGSYFSSAETIRARLESHVIADDVVVSDETAAWSGVTRLGQRPWAPGDGVARESDQVFQGRRGSGSCVECVFRRADGAPAWALAEDAPRVDAAGMERRRILAGIPAVPRDIGPADLPNEAGLEADAISYTKGCYLGQEVMARLKAMGQVRRRLVRVRGEGEVPAVLPAPVFAGARVVGEVRSAVRETEREWIGLALLSRLHVTAGLGLAWVAEGPAAVKPLEAP